MEGVRCAAAMRGRIGQGINDLELFNDGPGPPMSDDQRQRAIVLRPNVNEVDVHAIDLSDKLRQGVEPRFYSSALVSQAPPPSGFVSGIAK